jgi:uracil-DNA glycosylase
MEEFNLQLTKIKAFLEQERAANKIICPASKDVFRAMALTPLPTARVVILGQDPYHGPGQANGLSFSVNKGVPLPPSLKNIYKELEADCGIAPAKHGCLEAWAKQGVLLLNSILTVELGQAASHRNKGWEEVTDAIIQSLANRANPLAFVLWGDYAQKKAGFIPEPKHCVIRSPHPSPLSAHRGFFGSRPFSRINTFLRDQGQEPIDWTLD